MDELDNRIADACEQNKKGRELAESLAEIVRTETLGLTEKAQDRFWEVLQALLFGKKAGHSTIEPMTDREARMFGEEEMEFGKYKGKYIDEIPLPYLEWLANEQRINSKKIKRYLESKRIKQEQEASI